MSRVKVKKIKVPLGSKDEGLAEMFNQMLGTGSVNMTIAYPRYKKIRGICSDLVKLFELLASSPFMRVYTDFTSEKVQIERFCASSRLVMDEMFGMDFSMYEWNLTLVDDDQRKKFSEAYGQMKSSDLINTFIVMCDRLVKHKKHIADPEALDHRFITSMGGVEWCPFPFTDLNLKHIMSMSSIPAGSIKFFMVVLNKAYEYSYQLYHEVQSPDIDVDQFVEFIMKNIDEIQKRPELSRCREAFQKIKDSVALLKDRFNGYYRDFIATKDNTIMMQHFILDVSKETDASPIVTNQFRTIIAYYRKVAQSQISDPRVKMLFDKVNESFRTLDRGTENLVNIDETSAASSESSDEPPADSDPIYCAPIAKTAQDIGALFLNTEQ